MSMKRYLAILLVVILTLSAMGGCSTPTSPTSSSGSSGTSGEGQKVYKVANLVSARLGDKSFFDSCEAGLKELKDAGRIEYITIEMGQSDADRLSWRTTLEDVSATGEYDLIICGSYKIAEDVSAVAARHPEQKYFVFDSDCSGPNIVNINLRQNELGYIVGAIAAAMTNQTGAPKINEKKVIGFVGGMDSPVINDFLYGYIAGAQSVDPAIKVDTRYVNSYADTATAKELALSMINDKHVDVLWGVAGLSGNGVAEAAMESGKGWFIGVDSDQEETLPAELAAVTLTSGLKNVGSAVKWLFDEWDAGRTHWGEDVLLGLNDNGVGIVTDKNFAKAPQAVQDAMTAAMEAISSGAVTVPTAIGDTTKSVETLREAVRP